MSNSEEFRRRLWLLATVAKEIGAMPAHFAYFCVPKVRLGFAQQSNRMLIIE